ncbi:DUF6350 family protein [Microbacterium sp. ZW T5_45]|uniref:cell division protein PerM n=1 Tax=Microbacterium sp. ZW T5_45 TaxID=3378080 RepID=UPI0038555CDE
MQRLLVALLAAFDAAIAAAIGLAVLLAPLTLLWTLAFGADADWGTLWPLTGTLWQFGHGAAIDISLPTEVVTAVGIAPEAAEFVLSVTPLAFLVFTLLFAARSGARAAKAGAWALGALGGSIAFAAIAAVVAVTSALEIARTSTVAAILLPSAVYLIGAFCGAIRVAWEDGDSGVVDRLHDLVDSWGDWGPVTGSVVRGTAVAVVGVVGTSALAVGLMALLRAGEAVTLFETVRTDLLGLIVMSLGNLAYLPTLIVWAASWLAGPGFAVGVGTAVSPAGTNLGVVPGIPVLGLLPENGSIWMLVVVLVPIAVGAFAGWVVRSRLVWEGTPLRLPQRGVIALGIAVLTGGVAALAALLASGSIGPQRLAVVGPDALMFALALGGEVLVGAAILLLAPRHRDELAEERTDRWIAEMTASDLLRETTRSGTDRSDARDDGRPDAASPSDVPVEATPTGAGMTDADETAPLDDLPPRGSSR